MITCTKIFKEELFGGPGRTRTYDQGIHSALLFPIRVDYLITLTSYGIELLGRGTL